MISCFGTILKLCCEVPWKCGWRYVYLAASAHGTWWNWFCSVEFRMFSTRKPLCRIVGVGRKHRILSKCLSVVTFQKKIFATFFNASTDIFLIACHRLQTGITLHLLWKCFLINTHLQLHWVVSFTGIANVQPIKTSNTFKPDTLLSGVSRTLTQTRLTSIGSLTADSFTPLPGCFPLTAWQTGAVGFGRHSRSIHFELSGTVQETHTASRPLPGLLVSAHVRQNMKRREGITRTINNQNKWALNTFPVTITTHPEWG